MSNRKETPDVLGEILGGASEPATTTAPASPVKPAKTVKTKSATGSRAIGPKRAARKTTKKRPTWEYMSVRFRDYRGWRPRHVNGSELSGWKKGPLIEEYLNELGQDGWEMVGIVSSGRSERDAYFKRAAE